MLKLTKKLLLIVASGIGMFFISYSGVLFAEKTTNAEITKDSITKIDLPSEPESLGTQGVKIKQTPSEHIFKNPEDMQWGTGPLEMPAGLQMTILEGDPNAVGPFTIRLKFPEKYSIPLHWHPSDIRLTMLSGGADLKITSEQGIVDPQLGGKMLPMSFVLVPARMQTQFTFDVETIMELNGYGPFEIFYVNPDEDPRKVKKE